MLFLLPGEQSHAQFYRGSQQKFGKNRIQYRDFNWLYYPSGQFEVYFYQGGKELAEYTVQSASKNLEELESFFDYPLDDQIQIVVYNKQSEFRQSNIGLVSDDQYNIGGATRIVGSKVFLYFDGDYASYEKLLRSSLSEVLISQMMYGGDWKEVIKNSTLLTLPNWYESGLFSYASQGDDPERDAHIRDGIVSGKYLKFNRLEGDEAKYAGHALWSYVADVYGENVIPNILYMTRVSRNIESGFLFVLGVSLSTLTDEFYDYYEQQFMADDRSRNMPEVNPLFPLDGPSDRLTWQGLSTEEKEAFLSKQWRKKMGDLPVKYKGKYDYSEFKISPDGKFLAYVTNEMGQYKIWLHDIERGRTRCIYKREYRLQRIVDKTYPILAWHPSSQILTFCFEKRGRVFIGNYNMEKAKVEEKELFRIDKVISMDYSANGRQMVFSGVQEGQSDLFLYQVIGNNQSKLTDDIYDDLTPKFLLESDAIIFASNRPDDTLRTDEINEPFDLAKDIYILPLNGSREILERVTNTPNIDETDPSAYDSKNYTFLRKDGDYLNRYIASIDSAISRIDTTIHYRYFTTSTALSNLSRPPLEYDFDAHSGQYSLVFYKDEKIQYEFGNRDDDVRLKQSENNKAQSLQPQESSDVLTLTPEEDEKEVDIYNYRFEDELLSYEYEKESVRIESIQVEPLAADTIEKEFVLPKPRNYRLNFATDYVLSQVDNVFNNQFYQNFTGPSSMFPGLSGLVKLGISDLFEDYKIVGGFRLSGSLDNNDYGISFQNLRKRIDKSISFQRQARREFSGFSIIQFHTHTLDYSLKYPFTELSAVKASLIYRLDRAVSLATDPSNLARSNTYLHNVGLKVQYIFDNTINKGLNLYNGTRYKLWYEYYQDPTAANSDVQVAGIDVRHYQKLHRDLILALRFAGSTSFGNRNIVHYLGGVDNWLFQKIDNDMPIADDQNYYFQTLASPMRGFFVNSRNGNTFAVINAEVRWPIFKYLLNKPIKSDFIENFQVSTFSDVGSAWTGLQPYSDENRFNQVVLSQYPITVTVDNNREPIIWGYGFGLRSRVLGYFVRADWAWGVDDGIVLPRVFYLSLSMDF